MTTRNITKQFETLRTKCKAQHDSSAFPSSNKSAPANLLPNGSIDSSSAMNDVNTDLAGLMSATPPKWVDIADTVRTEMDKIDLLRTQLDQAYSQRLKVSFGDDAGEKTKEQLIETVTQQTTQLIKRIEGKIKSIAFCEEEPVVAHDPNSKKRPSQQQMELTNNEKNIRLNVMRNLGSVLHAKSKAFKQQQRDYLQKIQKQQHIGNALFAEIATEKKYTSASLDSSISNGDLGLMLDVALEQGLSDEQQRDLDEIEQRADDREKEIIHLAQNINELATLFQELNVLVIEQGTLLDRIDYNVEQTLVNTIKGREVLAEAEEKSSANWILKFMIIMVIVILLEVFILILKWKIMGR